MKIGDKVLIKACVAGMPGPDANTVRCVTENQEVWCTEKELTEDYTEKAARFLNLIADNLPGEDYSVFTIAQVKVVLREAAEEIGAWGKAGGVANGIA